MGRPPGSKTRPKASEVAGAVADKAAALHEGFSKRELPEDAEEFDRLTAPYRILVRPVADGISSTLQVFDQKALDKDEKESVVMSFSALLYQYGAKVDAGVLVALCLVGIAAPRIAETAAQKKARQEAKASQQAKEVSGSVVRSVPSPGGAS